MMGERSKTEFTIQQLQEELESARQNEARYRRLAEEAHALNQRVGQMTRAMGDISRSETLARYGLPQALHEILAQSSGCLQVSRAGVWLFEERVERLRCIVQLSDTEPAEPLSREQIPVYFAAIQEAVVIAADDIHTDHRTKELHDYALKHRVSALLDAPIRVFGELVGVVCHEHQGQPRVWLDEEKGFAAAIGDLIALALMTHREQRANLSASASEAKYRALVESLPVAVYSFQPYSEVLNYISPQIQELSGITVEEWHQNGGLRAWMARIHPNDRRLVEERIKKGMLIGKEPDAEYRVQHNDGSWRWIRDSYRSVRNADGLPVGLQGILQDITAQMQAQDEKREAERRFYDLLTQGQLFAFTLDEEGKLTFINDALSSLLERPREELLGRDWFELTLPQQERARAKEIFFSQQKSREEAAFELPLLLPDGRLTVRWAVTHLFQKGSIRSGVACIGMDLTERVANEARARESQRQESLSRLAAGAAHDMNNVITALRFLLDELFDNAATDETRESARDELQRCLQRSTEFTQGLLRFAKQLPSAPSRIQIDPFLAGSADLLRMLLGRSIELSLSLRSPNTEVFIDPVQLQQVLVNLATNAKDAMPDGGNASLSTEEIFIDPSMAKQLGLASGPYVKLQFRDAGGGISEENLSRVFEPTFTTKGTSNYGLGLAVSVEVVKQAAGKIDISSKEGMGTCVLVYLPKSKATE